VSQLGILRFSVLQQVLPRLVDVILYRWEHNLRAATTMGLVGAGGLGLEIITAFHLFEYREASALIIVLLGLVTVITIIGAQLRRRFLGG
jgi:phosphonate transport system permease protein